MEKKQAQNKRKSHPTEAKLLITTLSFAVTLGAWQALARQEANTANGEAAGQQPIQFALQTEPLPTLIPDLPEQPGSDLSARSSSKQPDRLFLGGTKPQAPRPAPIARTGSSR